MFSPQIGTSVQNIPSMETEALEEPEDPIPNRNPDILEIPAPFQIERKPNQGSFKIVTFDLETTDLCQYF